MLVKILIGVAVAIAALLGYAAMQPDTFAVQRSIGIQAPPERIFPLINDLRRFGEWSPYEKKDPAMKRSFSGPSGGKGAVYAWDGDGNVGQGRMEIAESVPPSSVAINLEFVRPFEARNRVDFTLRPQGGATEVSWAMNGPMPFVSKVICLFVDMDSMVGKDFEAGLANLKTLAEKQP